MKILLCGKGGSGKSTITTLLAKKMASEDNSVLVIDTDESNFGLHQQLGMELPDDFMEYIGGKKAFIQELMEKMPKGEPITIFNESWNLSEVPGQYVAKKGNISLLAIGKIHEVGEGCACPMGALSKTLISRISPEDADYVFIDTEAGIEHFGRGIETGCDVILAVVDPSYESVKLCTKIEEMARGLEKPFYFIVNKADDENRDILAKSLDPALIAGYIPSSKALIRANLMGEEIMHTLPEIDEITKTLLNTNAADD